MFTIGVEEELQLVDASTRRLVGRADAVLAAHGEAVPPDEGPSGIDHELQQSQLETVTPICRSLDEVRSNLVRLRGEAVAAAAERDCRVISAGTHPTARWHDQDVSDHTPYDRIAQDYAQLAEEQVVFGCHVHVGVADRELRVQAMNHVRPWLSTLLALSASSPFWEGRATGYASYRYLVFNRWPTFSTPATFDSWAALQAHVDLLLDTGAIDDPGRIYWTVRPSHRFDTLETRMCDAATTVDEAVMIAGVVRALVATAVAEVEAGRPLPAYHDELLRVAEWRAARFGLGGTLIDLPTGRSASADRVVDRLLAFIGPALDELGDRDEVTRLVGAQLVRGTSAARQRRTFDQAGSLDDVASSLIEETTRQGWSG